MTNTLDDWTPDVITLDQVLDFIADCTNERELAEIKHVADRTHRAVTIASPLSRQKTTTEFKKYIAYFVGICGIVGILFSIFVVASHPIFYAAWVFGIYFMLEEIFFPNKEVTGE
jgi:hypothetical protein